MKSPLAQLESAKSRFGLRLTSFSIANVLSFLKICYGVPADEVQVAWPGEDVGFQESWQRSTGMTFNWASLITQSDIDPLSKEEILSVYGGNKANPI
jgi:hypothetical protein